jgi:DNA polymerase epsilon subunit 2
MPPTAFVLFGNFLNNSSSGTVYNNSLKDHLKMLGEMISYHPTLAEQSQFLFVPGPTDPSSPNIFPRSPLPLHLTSEIRALVPSAQFLTNPARIQYCTQHIVLFREDIVTKMCRNAIYFPETGDIPNHFAQTLACQGHLAPLPLNTAPVYWDFDRSLYLYPLPDLVVTADKFEPFSAEHLHCKFINPGSFQRCDYSFKTYIPSTGKVEDSQIPGDEDEMN